MLPPDFKLPISACAELIRDEGTLGLPLMVIILAAYGEEAIEIYQEQDIVELYLRLEEDFNAQLTEEGENRIQAMFLALTTDMFYDDPLTLRSVSMALFEGTLGDMVDGVLEEVEIPEILWATYEVGLLRDDEEDFSPSCQAYIDRLVREVAEEQDLDAEEFLPFHVRAVHEQRQLLRNQLASLGVSELDLDEHLNF